MSKVLARDTSAVQVTERESSAAIALGEKLQIQWVPLHSVRLNPENPRLNEAAVEAVMQSIARFGFRVPLVVNRRTGIIEAGNTRWKAAQRMGLTEVPVIFADDDEVTALAFALADNRTAEIATWDEPSLAGLLTHLDAQGELAASAFSRDDLSGLLARLEMEDVQARTEDWTPPDRLPEGPTRVQPGQLWRLGRHRLLCGDSTDSTMVAALMAGDVAQLVATDPPYGVSYDGNAHRREHGGGVVYRAILNDDLDPAALEAFLTDAFLAALPHVADDASFYVWHASVTRSAFLAALSAVGVTVHQEIVWVKEGFQFSRSDYHWQHEPCLYGWRERHTFRGERNQSTVWTVPRESEHAHPTCKPVELWERPMRNHLGPGEICLDLFLGSGTALIAGERTGAAVRAMELDARYCDLAIARWEQFVGREAVKLDG
jgi:site-specific DNA-methyltransferase (adenine-specific)